MLTVPADESSSVELELATNAQLQTVVGLAGPSLGGKEMFFTPSLSSGPSLGGEEMFFTPSLSSGPFLGGEEMFFTPSLSSVSRVGQSEREAHIKLPLVDSLIANRSFLQIMSQRVLGVFSHLCIGPASYSLIVWDSPGMAGPFEPEVEIFEKKLSMCVHRIKSQEFVVLVLNETFETFEMLEEGILSVHVLQDNITMQGRRIIKSPYFDIGASGIFEVSQGVLVFLNQIPMEIELSRYLSAAYEELPPLKESQYDDGQQENEDETSNLGTSKKRIPTHDLLKPSWSLIDLPSIEIPGVAAINMSVNPCVTDIRSRRVSTKTHLFGELIGQALEDHKKKVKKFTFLVHGFVHGCKSQVDCRKITYDVRSEQGTVKATFELEEWKELKKIKDETILIEHIIELMSTDV